MGSLLGYVATSAVADFDHAGNYATAAPSASTRTRTAPAGRTYPSFMPVERLPRQVRELDIDAPL